MSLEPGHKLGPYEITGPAGAGGMGEVYKATDTRLDRTVAIKVLPSHLSENEELRARFDREARTISNLTHSNICALYDVGHEEGVDYLVMEYLEGGTLTQRIANGPMPIEEVLKVGIEICGALDVAHRNGVVHRDLKPGNVILTKSGAKLLDFGLAKLADARGDVVNSALTEMATQQHTAEPLTGQGTIVGTFQYMPPEQLEGKEVDARADVFALGAILYEMATGRKAFEGGSQASLIAAILERMPSAISTFQPMTPPALDHLVRACLAKDRDERIQTAHDVRLQLQWIREGGSQVGVPATVALSRRRRGWLGWGLAGILVVTTAVLALMVLGRQEAEPVILTAEIALPDNLYAWIYAAGGSFALSPDGRLLVASCREESGMGLWVRDMASGEVRRLNGTERGSFPFWSQDGRHIGFFASKKLKRIEADGGSAVTVCDVPEGRGGSWNRKGVIIFGKSTTDGIYSVPDGGGVPTQITTPDTTQDLEDNRFPWFLPDGEHFLFTARGTENAFLCVGSLSGGKSKQILPIRSNAAYVNGNVVYVRENTLVARPFDLGSLEFTGDARIVVEPVNRSDGYAHGSFSVSNTGVLVYGKSGPEAGDNVAIVDRSGTKASTIESETGLDDLVASQDARMLAMMRASENGSGVDIWTYDLERRVFTRATFTDRSDDPVFSPDGNTIAYSLAGNVVTSRTSGVGQPTELYRSNNDDLPVDWSRDGTKILFLSVSPETRDDVWVYDIATGNAEPILNTSYRETHPQFSPDGKWIAYASDESGRQQVYVIDYPRLMQKVQVSRDGGQAPRWRADGRELFFIAATESMAAVSLDVSGERLIVGEPAMLFATPSSPSRTHQYAVSPDGSSFYVIESGPGGEKDLFNVLVGWPATLGMSAGM